MKVRITVPALLLILISAVARPTLASASRPAPTAAQIRQAVRRAESSRNLWSTVNICNAPRYRDVIGIRGQMPALGFPASLSMNVQVDYFSQQQHQFVVDTLVRLKPLKLGDLATGRHQAGVSLRFSPHAGRLSGTVTFTWRRAGKVIGQTKRPTTPGHPGADFGHPEHYSAGECTIP